MEKSWHQFEPVVEQAMSDYLEPSQTDRPRAHVRNAFETSMEEFDDLYQKLAR